MRSRFLLMTICCFIVMLLVLNTVTSFDNDPVQAAQSKPYYVSGVFIAPDLTAGVGAKEWVNSFAKMKEIGINTIIVQYSLQKIYSGTLYAYFNYSGSNSSSSVRRSQIEYILSAAKGANMKVYLGLHLSEREWFDQNKFQDNTWLTQQYQLAVTVASELWGQFGSNYSGTIAGWYLPYEFESTSEYYSPVNYFSRLTSYFYGPLTTALKGSSSYGNLPIMISPLMYAYDNKSQWQTNMETVLGGSNIDIVAPQDGIGFGTQTHSTIADWYNRTRTAINNVNKNKGKSIKLWANCENYVRLRNPNETDQWEKIKPMAISKFIKSMETVAPYVDNFISFSIHRWDPVLSSNNSFINTSYYEAYKRYYKTGAISTNIANGYYVSIKPSSGGSLSYHTTAAAGLTDGFAKNTGWDQFKGIRSSGNKSFTMEIRFDDPVSIRSITSNYLAEAASGIALPSVKYEYLVRSNSASGRYDDVFNYYLIGEDSPSGKGAVESKAVLSSAIRADGVRITVTPKDEWTFIDEIWVSQSDKVEQETIPDVPKNTTPPKTSSTNNQVITPTPGSSQDNIGQTIPGVRPSGQIRPPVSGESAIPNNTVPSGGGSHDGSTYIPGASNTNGENQSNHGTDGSDGINPTDGVDPTNTDTPKPSNPGSTLAPGQQTDSGNKKDDDKKNGSCILYILLGLTALAAAGIIVNLVFFKDSGIFLLIAFVRKLRQGTSK